MSHIAAAPGASEEQEIPGHTETIEYEGRHNCRFSPVANRGGRVIGADALRISDLLRVSRNGQERKQGSEDNPNVHAHQGKPCDAWEVLALRSAALLTRACPLAIAYNRVGTGRNPSAVPSSSNFPASDLGSETRR